MYCCVSNCRMPDGIHTSFCLNSTREYIPNHLALRWKHLSCCQFGAIVIKPRSTCPYRSFCRYLHSFRLAHRVKFTYSNSLSVYSKEISIYTIMLSMQNDSFISLFPISFAWLLPWTGVLVCHWTEMVIRSVAESFQGLVIKYIFCRLFSCDYPLLYKGNLPLYS